MSVLYINIAEIAIVMVGVLLLGISKYYIRKPIVKYAMYITLAYFFIVLSNFMLINEVHVEYAILLQYYIYILAIYIAYKCFTISEDNEFLDMAIAIFLTVLSILPLLIWIYFDIRIVYFISKTIYAIILFTISARIVFDKSVVISKKLVSMSFMVSLLCLIFINLLKSDCTQSIVLYFIMVLFELLTIVLFVNAGHHYLKRETDKKDRIYKSVYNNSANAIVILYYETIEECNEKALEVFKTSRKNLIGKSIVNWSREIQEKGKSAEVYFYEMLGRVNREDIVGVDWIFHDSDIEEVASEISIFEIGNDRFAMLISDMSHRYVDEVTGFTKREYLRNRLSQSLEKDSERVALLALNIDNFKSINDEFGFNFGDKVLTIVSERLREEFSGNSISRIGGDEFIILVEGIDFLNQIYIYIEKIKNLFSAPVVIHNNNIVLSACIGVIYNSEGDMSASEMMNNVDFILNIAKKSGKGSVEFYAKNHKVDFIDRVNSERDMRSGIIDGEFIPFYQPIVSADDESIIGAEALVRWLKPDGSILYPSSFISLAEENGMIVDIDFSMLEKACMQCKELLDIYPDFVIHVNMSAYHFSDERIIKVISSNLRKYDLDGRHLVIEVTETLFVKELDKVSTIVDEIRKMGVLVALDDFGTGYSSLSYLSKINVDIIKIDRMFVTDIPYDEKANALIESIIVLNKTFNFDLVVEGVEEKEQVDHLKWYDIDYIQGYYYYKPVEFETVKTLLENMYGI